MKKALLLPFLVCATLAYGQTFNEVAASAGIDHTYDPMNAMGGGAVFFDYDNDGWDDLYLTSGHGPDHLYRNNQDGTFTNLTSSAGLTITGDYYTIAAIAGDIDNDDDQDLFVTTWGENLVALDRNLLFINNGDGTFTEQGVSYGLTEESFSMGATFLDYDRDGFLDIYVVNYVDKPVNLTDENDNIIGFDHICHPNLFYKNNGDGSFTEMAATLGVDNAGCALAIMATDYDLDDDMDLYVANDFGEWVTPNAMLENQYPSDSFTDVSVATGTDIGIYGMGIGSADMDKDGDFDYYITNLGRNVLIEDNGSHVFSDVTTAAGVENTFGLDAPGTFFATGWGAAFADINNDTWPDLFVANGKVPAADFIANATDDPNKLYLNNGDNTFADISTSSGVDNSDVGRGMAYSDYDKDGDIDILVVVQEGLGAAKTLLYQNSLNTTSRATNHWVQFDLQGTKGNKDALGAKVKVHTGGEVLIQEVQGGGSHCGQNTKIIHFGLGSNTVIDKVEVQWLGTGTQDFGPVGIDGRYELVEGQTLANPQVSETVFQLYPNPVSDGTLYFSNLTDFNKVDVFNLLGKKVMTNKLNSQTSLDVSVLSSGMYFLKFSSPKEEKTFKVLID